MKRNIAVLLVFFFALPIVAGHASSSSSSSSAAKTVQVNGYKKKDGTVVNGYQRAAPGSRNATTAPAVAPANVSGTAAPRTAMPLAPKPKNPHVLGDAKTKRYYRESCVAPASAISMLRSAAIAAGYRPDPGCYAH